MIILLYNGMIIISYSQWNTAAWITSEVKILFWAISVGFDYIYVLQSYPRVTRLRDASRLAHPRPSWWSFPGRHRTIGRVPHRLDLRCNTADRWKTQVRKSLCVCRVECCQWFPVNAYSVLCVYDDTVQEPASCKDDARGSLTYVVSLDPSKDQRADRYYRCANAGHPLRFSLELTV